MLNGIDPIILFNFSKLLSASATESLTKIPVVSDIISKVGLPPIPIYLSESITGLYIESEDKNIDIQTDPQTTSDGGEPVVNQKGLNNTIKINLLANKDSIGLTLLSAMMDLIFEKVTSKEYSITYLHGPITVFNGLLHGFSIQQNSADTLMNISLELYRSTVKTIEKAPVTVVSKVTGAVPL